MIQFLNINFQRYKNFGLLDKISIMRIFIFVIIAPNFIKKYIIIAPNNNKKCIFVLCAKYLIN